MQTRVFGHCLRRFFHSLRYFTSTVLPPYGTKFLMILFRRKPGITYFSHNMCLLTISSTRKKQLGSYNAALLSICFILLLGFIDDVLELRWSVKILLSFVGTLPLLVEYSGPTLIIVPKPLVSILGNSLPLGSL